MIKRIPVSQTIVGMYLVRPDGNWMDHNLWSGKFLIRDTTQLATITGCGATHVWIDTARGLDVAAPADTASDGDAGRDADAPMPADDTGDAPDTGAPNIEAAHSDAPDAGETCPSGPQGHPAATRDTRRPALAEPTVAALRTTLPARARPAALEDELPRASQILDQAKSVVQETLVRAQNGEPPDLEACRTVVAPMVESAIRNASALTTLIRLRDKDDYSYMHSVSVSTLMILLGRELGFDDAQCMDAGLAGLLHDVGKALIPSEVLNKPGRLTDAEFDLVKSHPRRGHDLLRESGLTDAAALDVCLHHHERVDGLGYPDRLKDESLGR